MCFTAYVLCSFRFFKFKIEGQIISTEALNAKLQTKIKILANPRLA